MTVDLDNISKGQHVLIPQCQGAARSWMKVADPTDFLAGNSGLGFTENHETSGKPEMANTGDLWHHQTEDSRHLTRCSVDAWKIRNPLTAAGTIFPRISDVLLCGSSASGLEIEASKLWKECFARVVLHIDS